MLDLVNALRDWNVNEMERLEGFGVRTASNFRSRGEYLNIICYVEYLYQLLSNCKPDQDTYSPEWECMAESIFGGALMALRVVNELGMGKGGFAYEIAIARISDMITKLLGDNTAYYNFDGMKYTKNTNGISFCFGNDISHILVDKEFKHNDSLDCEIYHISLCNADAENTVLTWDGNICDGKGTIYDMVTYLIQYQYSRRIEDFELDSKPSMWDVLPWEDCAEQTRQWQSEEFVEAGYLWYC